MLTRSEYINSQVTIKCLQSINNIMESIPSNQIEEFSKTNDFI